MRTRPAILLLLALGMGAFAAEPALERVSVVELESPLSVQLMAPPAETGGAEDFNLLWRDPRFPSVVLRRHGALYAAFRRSGPVPTGRTSTTIPSDIVYFMGRPTPSDIAGVWPDAVKAAPVERPRAAPIGERVEGAPVAIPRSVPRMAHQPTRARRLAAMAEKYGPGGD